MKSLPVLSSNTQLGIQQQLRKLYKRIVEYSGIIPDLRFNDTSYQGLRNYLDPIHRKTQKCEFGVGRYNTDLAPLIANAYIGAVYAPTLNRIYLVPFEISNQASWHYIDCNTGKVVAYAHNLGVDTPVNQAYTWGGYDPYNDILWFTPANQGTQSKWHYVDGKTGKVVAYEHGTGVTVDHPYYSAIYSPKQNRMYLVPLLQFDQGNYHYIDCETKTVVAYTPTNPLPSISVGGSYDPINDRIYFAPWPFPPTSNDGFSYINCKDGSVETLVSDEIVQAAYAGAIFSPTLRRIYFIPYRQTVNDLWHYIDCDTNEVVLYNHGVTIVDYGYNGGAYSAASNRIYFSPFLQYNETYWHYIDCNTGEVAAYISENKFQCTGAVYVPNLSRVYLTPSLSGTASSDWIFIQEYTDVEVSRSLSGGCLYNKTP